MPTQVVLELPDQVYERAQQLAQSRRQAVTEVITAVLDDALELATEEAAIIDRSESDEVVERETSSLSKNA